MKSLVMTLLLCVLFYSSFLAPLRPSAEEKHGGGLARVIRDRGPERHLRSSEMRSHRVSPKPLDLLGGTRRLVPQEYATIQAAINASINGDTVLVSDGTYLENIRFKGKAIIVASLCLVDGDTAHIDATVIDGSNPSNPDSASVVSFIDGEDTTSVLYGLTITGGSGTDWIGSVVWRAGGGVYCDLVYGAKIVRNLITRNRVIGRAAFGGGVAIEGIPGITNYFVLEGNRIVDNYVNGDSLNGLSGGADIYDVAWARVIGNVFERDTVVGQNYAIAGGIYLYGTGTSPLPDGVVRNNVIRGNVAQATINNGLAAGLAVAATGPVTVTDNLFEDNVAKSSYGYAEGAGLLNEETGVSGYGRKMIVGNWFIRNQTSSEFGNAHGAGIELFNATATVSGNYFAQNTSVGGAGLGGAIGVFGSAFRLENNILAQNSSNYGGAIYVSGAPPEGSEQEMINNTVVGNHAQYYGGGLYISSGANIVALNDIFWSDTAGAGDPEISLGGGVAVVLYSDVQGGWPGTGNIDADPLFADTIYPLASNSPCIATGIDSIEIGGVWYYAPMSDYGGNPRPMPVGTPPDMGAWEYQVAVGVDEPFATIPETYYLFQNYPNPFNPSTVISFQLPVSGSVTLRVHNLLGQEVATLVNEEMKPGSYEVTFDATGLASGVYLYRLTAGSFSDMKKLLVLK